MLAMGSGSRWCGPGRGGPKAVRGRPVSRPPPPQNSMVLFGLKMGRVSSKGLGLY